MLMTKVNPRQCCVNLFPTWISMAHSNFRRKEEMRVCLIPCIVSFPWTKPFPTGTFSPELTIFILKYPVFQWQKSLQYCGKTMVWFASRTNCTQSSTAYRKHGQDGMSRDCIYIRHLVIVWFSFNAMLVWHTLTGKLQLNSMFTQK